MNKLKKKKRTEKIKEFKIMTERKRETLWYCLGGEKMEKGAQILFRKHGILRSKDGVQGE